MGDLGGVGKSKWRAGGRMFGEPAVGVQRSSESGVSCFGPFPSYAGTFPPQKRFSQHKSVQRALKVPEGAAVCARLHHFINDAGGANDFPHLGEL